MLFHFFLTVTSVIIVLKNEIVKNILPRYENNLASAPVGKPYNQCFDMNTATAQNEYVDFVDSIKKVIAADGIPLKV